MFLKIIKKDFDKFKERNHKKKENKELKKRYTPLMFENIYKTLK